MKQLKKNLMFVGVAAFGLLLTAEAQAQVTGRAVKVRPEVSTRPETAGMSSLRMAAKNSPALRPMLQRLESMQAQGQLNAGSAREMATVISGLAVQLGLSKADLSKLPNEAQINAAIAQAADAEFSLVSKGATGSNAALGLMESLNNAKNICDLALSKKPVNAENADLSVDQEVALSEASYNVANFVATLGYYIGANSALVSRNFFDLVNSGDAGQVDLDVALGLSAVFSGAGFGLINDRIKVMAVDGLDASEQAVIQQCSMAWGVEGLEASRGVDSSNRMAADVASACSVETSGVTLSASQIRSLCKI